MKKEYLLGLSIFAACLACIAFASCGRGTGQTPLLSGISPHAQEAGFAAPARPAATWPEGLPADRLQPWEELDANGFAVGPVGDEGRAASRINELSDFTPGVERFSEAGDVSDLDEASRFASGSAGGGGISYAFYEITLGPDQPGTVCAEVNLRPRDDFTASAYWLGLSDYGGNTWKWNGPFSDSHVRLSVPPGDYTSELGGFFVCVLAYDGANFDLVGLGVEPRDDTDTDPPTAPAAPTLTPVFGGILVEWIPAVADDLAGYRVYYSSADFTGGHDFGVKGLGYLKGCTRHLLAPLTGETFVRLAAVDLNGNESELSPSSSAEPQEGSAPLVSLATDAVSGKCGFDATLTASGGASYDFDLDGDGEFDDLTDDESGSAPVHTDLPGIVRPAVRGVDEGGAVAFASVALIVRINSRPVASAQASPASGQVPLLVSFTGTGEDEEGEIAHYYWDFDGDGVYDEEANDQQNPEHTYSQPGLYNAKLRVEDVEGAWDVDTVSINALPDPENEMPRITGISASPTISPTGEDVSFTATGYDPDGTIESWEWDFANDGIYDSSEQNPAHAYDDEDSYCAKLRVTDDEGGIAVEYVNVLVKDGLLNFPPQISYISVSPDVGKAPLDATFYSFAFDVDGGVSYWMWDFDNNGIVDDEGIPPIPSVEHRYENPGFYTAMLAVRDNDDATTKAYVGVNVWRNLPPVAILEVYPSVNFVGETGYQTVRLDAGSSYDPEPAGGDLEYSYDPYGNGNWNLWSTQDYFQASYWYPGIYHAGLRVRDEDSAIVRDARAIYVYQHQPFNAVTSGNAGEHLDLAEVAGAPAISFYDPINGDLKYARSTDSRGVNWDSSVTAAALNDVGINSCLSVVEGRPAIAFYDATNGDLKYVRAGDAYGDAWGAVRTPDASANDVGQYCSLAVIDGNPAISYYDSTAGDLKFVRATNTTGSLWGAVRTPDDTDDVGQYTSLVELVGNYPAISYYDATNGTLEYVRAISTDGSTWDDPVTVDDGGLTSSDVGRYTSMTLVSGIPAIAYQDAENRDLNYVIALDSSGGSWEEKTVVDSDNWTGYYASLAVWYGLPAIAYRDGTNEDLKFALENGTEDEFGYAWGDTVVVDSEGDMGRYASLAIVNGKPCIAYRDGDDQDALFAYPMTE